VIPELKLEARSCLGMNQTIQRAEMMAVIHSAIASTEFSKVNIYTDSQATAILYKSKQPSSTKFELTSMTEKKQLMKTKKDGNGWKYIILRADYFEFPLTSDFDDRIIITSKI